MKKILISIVSIFAIVTILGSFTSCKKTKWDVEYIDPSPYGNNTLDEHTAHVISISSLKENPLYKNAFTTSYTLKEITDDIYIRGVVTGNDIGGNMYSEVTIQDETGAIAIEISQSGIWGYLPLGQEILVKLQGLYAGNYGAQPEIGMPYTSSSKNASSYGQTYVSRMDPTIWHQHFKILGQDLSAYYRYALTPFDPNWDPYEAAGKIATLYNVTFKLGGKETFFDLNAYDTGTSSTWNTSRYFKEYGTNVFTYTSRYAKFAADTLPAGTCDVTGVIKRYNNNFEFIIIKVDDIVENTIIDIRQ